MRYAKVRTDEGEHSILASQSVCGEPLSMKKCNASDYSSPREARQNLTEYLRFYNERRIHQALDYRVLSDN